MPPARLTARRHRARPGTRRPWRCGCRSGTPTHDLGRSVGSSSTWSGTSCQRDQAGGARHGRRCTRPAGARRSSVTPPSRPASSSGAISGQLGTMAARLSGQVIRFVDVAQQRGRDRHGDGGRAGPWHGERPARRRRRRCARTGPQVSDPPDPAQRLEPVVAGRRRRRASTDAPSTSMASTLGASSAGRSVASDRHQFMVTQGLERGQEAAERALSRVQVGHARSRPMASSAATSPPTASDRIGSGRRAGPRRPWRPWAGRRPARSALSRPMRRLRPPGQHRPGERPRRRGPARPQLLSRRSSCGCPPCAGPACPRPWRTRRRPPRR